METKQVQKIVIIGDSVAGIAAAVAAGRKDLTAQVLVVSRERIPYRRAAIPTLIAGYIKCAEEVKIFAEEATVTLRNQTCLSS